MARVFLHIGLNKTGTSSIQDILYHNYDFLRSKGVLYPKTWFKDGGHHELVPLARRSKQEILADARFRDLEEEIGDAETVIMSSEPLWNLTGLEHIRTALGHHDVRAVIYLRHHLPHLLSWYQQNVQAAIQTADPLDFVHFQRFSYVKILTWLAERFGRDKLEIRVYDRARLKDGDSVADFFDVCGIPMYEELQRKPWEQNPSITGNLLFFKRVMNFVIDREETEMFVDEMTDLAKLDETFTGGLFIPGEDLRHWNNIFAHDVRRVRENFGIDMGPQLQKLKGHPSPDWSRWERDFEMIVEGARARDFKVLSVLPRMRRLAGC